MNCCQHYGYCCCCSYDYCHPHNILSPPKRFDETFAEPPASARNPVVLSHPPVPTRQKQVAGGHRALGWEWTGTQGVQHPQGTVQVEAPIGLLGAAG